MGVKVSSNPTHSMNLESLTCVAGQLCLLSKECRSRRKSVSKKEVSVGGEEEG